MTGWAVPGFVPVRELRTDSVGRRVLARRAMTRRFVSVTYLSRELRTDSEFRDRFVGGFGRLARIRDARVARLWRYLEYGEDAAIVADQVTGTSLRALLREEGAVGTEAALVLLKDVLRGLAACHDAGVMHGDLKPENLILTRTGRVRLVDVGLFTCAGRRLLARATPFYLAPEQWSGAPATQPGDVYAATATFFECLAGGPPFHADGAAALSALHEQRVPPVDAVPEAVRHLVRGGLAKDPASRPDPQRFLNHIEQAANNGLGPGWERRGRRELTRLKAGSSHLPTLPALAGLGGKAGWRQLRPGRLAGVLGGAFLLTVALSSPPLHDVWVPDGPGNASDSEGPPVRALPPPPVGATRAADVETSLVDRVRNPRSVAVLGAADPTRAGRALQSQEFVPIPSAYQADRRTTFGGRQRRATATPTVTPLVQPPPTSSAATTSPATPSSPATTEPPDVSSSTQPQPMNGPPSGTPSQSVTPTSASSGAQQWSSPAAESSDPAGSSEAMSENPSSTNG